MKALKNTCNLIFIAALLAVLLPLTAFADVILIGDGSWYGETAAAVYSSLTNLTSTNPSQVFLWSSPPTVPYTATLSADSEYSLPPSITVQRVKYYDIETQEPIVPATVDKTYASGTDYTYNASSGEIVIPVAALGEIVYDQSPYHIQIVASGVANTAFYTVSITQSAHGTISPATAEHISHGSDCTFTFTPDAGYHIADVLADGESVGAVKSYTFTDIQSNHTITALFEETAETPPPAEPASSSETQPSPEDALDDIPKMGDSSLWWIWRLLLGVSAAGTAVLIIIRKRASLNR